MTTTPPIRLLIADDHAIVRQGLTSLLAQHAGIEIAGEAGNGHEAIELAAATMPDVILMDVKMSGLNGIEATRRILAHNPEARILMLSSFSDDALIVEAVQAGALGYMLKEDSLDELVAAINQIHSGAVPSNTVVAQTLLRRLKQIDGITEETHGHQVLTERELEVVRLLATGGTNASIAETLSISERTVGTHISNAMRKLGSSNRTQLVLYALRNGLASLDPEDEDDGDDEDQGSI